MEENTHSIKELFARAMSAFVGNDYRKSLGWLTEVISRNQNHFHGPIKGEV